MGFLRIIVAGGRSFSDYMLLKKELFKLLKSCKQKGVKVELVSGGCPKGADRLGELFAKSKGLKVKLFPADWDKHGKSAGFIRNGEMAEYADGLIAFWDGKSKGTANMINNMKKLKKPARVVFYG